MFYYWDPTYFLVLIGAVICLIASANVKSTYSRYANHRSMSGMTGAEVAQRILHAAGIYDVKVGHVRGDLTDHYSPIGGEKEEDNCSPTQPHPWGTQQGLGRSWSSKR